MKSDPGWGRFVHSLPSHGRGDLRRIAIEGQAAVAAAFPFDDAGWAVISANDEFVGNRGP